MTGLILSGGESSRMGTDKGLLLTGEKTWVEHISEILGTAKIPVYISVNKSNHAAYLKIFQPQSLIIDNDSIPSKGPLLGILSAHIHFPGEDLFVLPCDLQSMNSSLIGKLISHYQKHPDAEIVHFTLADEPEPLCAIYTSASLDSILSRIRTGEIKRFSLKYILSQYKTYGIPLSKEESGAFKNYNSPEDLGK